MLTNTNLLDGTHSLSDTETCTTKEKEQELLASPGGVLNPGFYSNWQRFVFYSGKSQIAIFWVNQGLLEFLYTSKN